SVGYGSSFTATQPMRIGIAACGYADGYPRLAPGSNERGTPVLVDGVRTRTARSGPRRVMNDRFAIGLAALSPETRRRVDRDAWLLMVWWLAVGLAATVLLHRVGAVRSPLWRYPLTALLMYALGEVVALRAWLAVFARSVRRAPSRWRVATEDERGWQPRMSRRT